MGFSGSYIPGHSGTQFKHRRGFASPKAHLDDKRKQKAGLPRHGERRSYLGRQVDWPISLLLLTAGFVLIVLFAGKPIYDSFEEHRQMLPLEEISQTTNPKTVLVDIIPKKPYLGKAQSLLRHGELYQAQELFQQALAAYPYDYDSNVGLAATLVFQCVELDENCLRAKEYLDFSFQLYGNDVKYLLALERKLERCR